MAKQLNVNLAFTADTGKAKAQLQDLQRQLDNLIKGSPSATNFAITDKLIEAQGAAAALKVALDQSMNVQTGKLDLTRFNDSIKKSGLSLKDLKVNLEMLGPTGSQTFMSLSKSILSAEVPLRRTSTLLNGLWTTMKNTARWQLSSSMLHGFMGTIQSAYGYAKDLDQSLNSIRIVTGQNTEQMAKFAEEANKAAKILSTTTTNYTNASLIYYQQGLSDQEVLERTNATIKMANVAGQTAEVVSNQMTAVWNNFDDGSKSLEYYADVMTALGATTASSTAEIADGLEKFAAVAETVGLSYEYATSALATVTATTRQSADVVGTAFKTLFARIQGLNLGETLDDGTTLNKYSSALDKVGISIFNQYGEMKEMDAILDEMGNKWNTLNKDQQVALAQTVAGVRQYTQLIALMDNWDFFKENLETANNATGALSEQADIYADSWKAARDRVKASMEDIYDSILDEKFFIGLLNGFDDALNIVADLTDSLNGLPGVLSMIGVVLTKVFTPQLTQIVDNMIYGLNSLTGANAASAKATKDQAYNLASNMGYDDGTRSGEAIATSLKTQLDLQKKLIDNEKNLSSTELKRLQTLMDINQQYSEQAIKAAQAEDAARVEVGDASRDIRAKVVRSAGSGTVVRNAAAKQYQKNRDAMQQEIQTGAKYQFQLENTVKNLNPKNVNTYNNALTGLSKNLAKIGQLDTSSKIKALQNQFSQDKDLNKFKQGLSDIAKSGNIVNDTVINASDNFRGLYPNVNLTSGEVDNLANKDMKLAQKTLEANSAMQAQQRHADAVANAITSAKVAADTLATSIVKVAGGVSQMAMGVNSIKAAIDTFNNDDMAFGEKFLSITMSLSMGLPMLINGFKALLKVKYATIASSVKELAVNGAVALSHSKLATSIVGETVVMKAFDATTKKATLSLAGFAAASGVIIGIVGGIVALSYALAKASEAYHADARAAERAAEAAKNLAEEASKVKQELNDLENTVSGYEAAIEALKACDEETEAWREALEKVNAETISILEKYPELMAMGEIFNSDGTIKSTVLDDAIAKAREKSNQASYASLQGTTASRESTLQADITNFKRQSGDYGYKPLETQKEGFIGYDKTINKGEFLLENQDKFTEQDLANDVLFKEALSKLTNNTEMTAEEWEGFINSLVSQREAYADILKQTEETSNIISEANKTIATQLLGPIDYKSDEQEKERDAYAQQLDEKTDERKDYWKKQLTTNLTRIDDAPTELLSAMRKIYGDEISFSENAVQGNKNNRVFEFVIDGQKQTFSAEQLINQISSYEAQTEVAEDKTNEIVDALEAAGVLGLNEGVSLDLINTLKERLETSDGLDVETLSAELQGKSLLEQEEILNRVLSTYQETNGIADIAAEADKIYDLDAESVEHYAESLVDLANKNKEVSKDLKDNATMAGKVAVANSRMNKGLITLAENFADYRKTITTAEKGTEEYNTALKGISDAMNDVLGLDDVELSQDFLTDTVNLDLMAQAAKGSTEAVESLRAAAAQDILTHVELDPSVDPADKQKLIDNFNALQTELDGLDLSIGAKVDTAGMYDELNNMIRTTQMTTEQVQDYFNALGYTPEIETDTVDQVITHTGAVPIMSDDGKSVADIVKYTWTEEAQLQVPIIKSLTYHGDAGKTVNTGAVQKAGGGNSSKPTKVDKTKKSDVVDRYKEVDDAIDDLTDSIDDANKAADRLFGANKIKSLEKERDLLKQQIPLLKKKRDEAKAYLAIDKQLLMDTGKKYGITFKTDGAGNITNYTAELTKLYDELAKAEEKMNSMSDKEAQEKYQEATLDPLNEKIKELKDAIAQYDETRELLEDLNDQIDEAFNAWQDKNYEILTYKLEIELELNDAELEELDFELRLLEGDFYRLAEAASFMKDQVDPLSDSLSDLDSHFKDLEKAYTNKKISQADYIEGLKETRDSIYDQLNALVDLDEEMMEYYGNTLDAAMEELDKYTDHMEHLTGVIEHYISLMELMGKSTDFEAMDGFLNARAETTKNELDVAKSNYEMLKRNSKADEYYENYQKALADDDQDMAEWWKTQWEAEIRILDEAQAEMLSKTEEGMEATKNVIENNMKKAAKALEDALTGGMSFDHMMTELDRLNERQEEYLTKTNQVYETNKLMRQAAQAADKTDNAVAKQKFKNFAEETKQLQEKGQLSKYELEIQQAKYDLLLAEIALEDAQNAKSTVRLQRDSEGNFGYVYTADQDKISEAQQAVEDAENDLYNISLNGQQEYTEKYTQALQSMYDEMKALQEAYLNGDIATEQEYQARKEALMQHYFGVPDGILTTYSNLYNVAVQTDADATADFWAKSYGDMTANTEEFKTAVNGYLVEIETETEIWHEITKAAQEDITEGLDDLVDESEEYADVVDDEVIPALEDELDAVEDLTASYADQRDEVLRLIQTYRQLVQAINAAIAAAARQSGSGSRTSTGDLSLDAANAFVEGDYVGMQEALDERDEEMETGDHPLAMDQDELQQIFYDAMEGDPEAIKIINLVVNSGGELTFHGLRGLATGGYTGEWGPEGKLAILHQKEIVLNADDTANLLSTVNIVRGIVDFIDKQANWASTGLGFMSASGVPDYNQTLEQMVEIHAEFPNATNHNEIEEAFNNLMNKASQYANRKNK